MRPNRACSILDTVITTDQHAFGLQAGDMPFPSALRRFATQQGRRLGLEDVNHIIAVASGKGGVGKSTTAVNLAVAMAAALHLRVGLVDADVHGPSIPTMMNLSGQPAVAEGKASLMRPLENHGVKCMSMGFFMKGDDPVVWRGPMASSAVDKFMLGTDWGSLDVLVVDMPPGTGDAQINLGQRLPLSGAVIVSTPQDVALLDARRGAQMFNKVRVPLLGLVENMSYFTCSNCGHKEHIFGQGGVQRVASDMGLDVLGQVPLETNIRVTSDSGSPIVLSDPSSSVAQAYVNIAKRVMEKLAASAETGQSGTMSKGPSITMS